MNYDKSSFIAGVAVGRQLKGWGSGDRRGDAVVADPGNILCAVRQTEEIALPCERSITADGAGPVLSGAPISTFSPAASGVFAPSAILPGDGYIVASDITAT